MKGRNHVIFSVDREKAPVRIEHPFMTNAPNKVGTDEIYVSNKVNE